MTKLQFDVLRLTYEYGYIDVDVFGRELFKSTSEINLSVKQLTMDGYIVGNKVSEKGDMFLQEGKIDNAIILAAGLSSRFVPLSFELPKGLLPVKGEPLIERQIKQLNEKGIKEIIVVVGYMKEKFEYLVDKYGVKLVYADDYETRNNHASVYAARDYLKNSIITSSDLYFTKNIFQTYAYDSYYCTIYKPGKTAERGIETDDDDKIINTFYGDKCYDIWVTLGYAYFTKRFSRKMIEFIKNQYLTPESAGMFWADIQDKHLQELYMYAKRCADDVIYEFDSLEELREFDDSYISCAGSAILAKVCKLIGASECDISAIESLRKLKNSLFKFRYRDNVYICDVNPSTEERIHYLGKSYYQCRDFSDSTIKLYKMNRSVKVGGQYVVDTDGELNKIYDFSKEFKEYHERALPLCAAEM